MATLNLSTNGPSIQKSYQSIVNAQWPSSGPASSSTYGQWAVYSVSAPLVNAFQTDSGKESVLKVHSTGEGELVDLIDEFSDGKIQFAFVKVKDSNTTLPKSVLIGWCGEGVPERTKGYFTSHSNAVSKMLHGYHVQITARSDRDLTPENIIQKVADASGSKYSASSTAAPSSSARPTPPVASKPVFTPTTMGRGVGVGGGFNPLGSRAPAAKKDGNVDEDGWGADAPPVTRTQLEKVQSAYKPTKVNMKELTSQKQETPRFDDNRGNNAPSDTVQGAYQPIGKVDIAAIRRQAQASGSAQDDRPTIVKGAYEPVGKVDIAAIRARAQKSSDASPVPQDISPAVTGGSVPSGGDEQQRSLADRSAVFTQSERLTSLPKPKVTKSFGYTAFAGTKAPTPGGLGFDSKPVAPAAPVGSTSRTFADEGGKTPAQIWAEKKARERGFSGSGDPPASSNVGSVASPIKSQPSGGEWKSGYAGKSWATVQTTNTGRSAGSSGIDQQHTGGEQEQEEGPTSPAGGVGALRDRFVSTAPMGAAADSSRSFDREPSPPPLAISSKPSLSGHPIGGVAMPGLPSRPSARQEPEEEEEPVETPPARSDSPIRVAMPVSRGAQEASSPVEQEQPPSLPTQPTSRILPKDEEDEPVHDDPARPEASASTGSKRAIVQFDYEKAEDNEIELIEGQHITNIDMVDEDWWMGTNAKGESGLFPSNYVEIVEEDAPPAAHSAVTAAAPPEPQQTQSASNGSAGATATAIYDYDAAEDNELGFPEGAKITNVTFPDEDWWMGEYRGKEGLFPANYVELNH